MTGHGIQHVGKLMCVDGQAMIEFMNHLCELGIMGAFVDQERYQRFIDHPNHTYRILAYETSYWHYDIPAYLIQIQYDWGVGYELISPTCCTIEGSDFIIGY